MSDPAEPQTVEQRLDAVEESLADIAASGKKRLDQIESDIGAIHDSINDVAASGKSRLDGHETRLGTVEQNLNQTRGWLGGVQDTANRADEWIRQTGDPFVRNFTGRGTAATVQPAPARDPNAPGPWERGKEMERVLAGAASVALIVFAVFGAIFFLANLPWGSSGERQRVAYTSPATALTAPIQYTGRSCMRRDGSQGREGYSIDGRQLGCWRY